VRDDDAPLRPGAALTVAQALDLFDAQLGSLRLDLAARALRADGIGYYTIGSSGHEGNAGVAAARCPEGQTLAQSINAALQHVFETHPEAILFGEDVARKGGVYGVTRGLQKRFGPERVFDTMFDEQIILGLARLPEELRRPLPQRQFRGRTARHPWPHHCLPVGRPHRRWIPRSTFPRFQPR
jgi:hypothetical protein